MKSVNSTCPYCGVGCGVRVESTDTSAPRVVGDELHPANYGRLCSKGSALAETLLSENQGARLAHPSIDGESVSWGQASQHIANKISDCIDQYGSDSVAFYLSGQLLTEDYYVANKLMKGFIGSANVDTNSRLCMASAVAAYKRSFGADAVPCSYEDIDHADLIVLIGSNAAWTHPVLYQRMVAAKESNPNLKVVLIDPRETASCDIADMHLAIKPSSDGFVFQGLLKYLIDTSSSDEQYIAKHTDGFDGVLESLQSVKMDDIVAACDVDKDVLIQFYEWFAETKKTISFYSQGINQSASGTDKCNAIINCHLASGKIGYEGAGPFSITGQPNAMGGREVGGLANQLAAHMDFAEEDCDRVQRFWQSPNIAKQAGLKAVDLFDAINDGRIKFLWVMATNPAVSLPDSNKVRRALEKCPTVVVSDVTHTDTTRFANILLPAKGWSEKDGTVTNSERRISRQRGFKQSPADAKSDWWALSSVASKMGYQDHFDYQSVHEIFLEHACLSGFENNGSRAFDISGLSELSLEQYDELQPMQWPVNALKPTGTKRLFEGGEFFTENRRARFIASMPMLAKSAHAPLKTQEFMLNTGRLRDHWHTMTRTGNAPSLSARHDAPTVEINRETANRLNIRQSQMLELSNANGSFFAAAHLSDGVAGQHLFSPIHWSDHFASNAVVSALFDSTVDSVSGQPESKATRVELSVYKQEQWARIASSEQLDCSGFDYWVQAKTKRGYVTLLGVRQMVDWRAWAELHFGSDFQFVEYKSETSGTQTLQASSQSDIKLLICSNRDVENLPGYAWLASAFDSNDSQATAQFLRSESGGQDQQICSCFQVSRKSIELAVNDGASDLAQLAANFGCGSKCGSCKPELSQMIQGRTV